MFSCGSSSSAPLHNNHGDCNTNTSACVYTSACLLRVVEFDVTYQEVREKSGRVDISQNLKEPLEIAWVPLNPTP